MTVTGTIATWVIAAIVFAAFAYGIYHIYRTFFKGEAVCCKEGSSCGSCCCCHEHAKEKTPHKLMHDQ